MRKIDYKHIAFHVLVGIYFLWLIVCGFMLVMVLLNIFGEKDAVFNSVFQLLVSLNLFMGLVLFTVIRLFKSRAIVGRIILYSFICIIIAALAVLATVLIVK